MVVQGHSREEGARGDGTENLDEFGEGEVRWCYNDRFINL